MGERLIRRSWGPSGRALLAALLCAGAAVGAGSAQAAGSSSNLYGWQVAGVTYPARALDLFAPAGTALTATRVHVNENGHPVTPLTVTPVSRAAPGDFGVEVLVDRSRSVPIDAQRAELAALRAYAATRTGNQQLGIVTISGHPALPLPLTADAGTIAARLTSPLPSAPGQDVTRAMTLGLAQLGRSHVALGAMIVLSDGAHTRVDASRLVRTVLLSGLDSQLETTIVEAWTLEGVVVKRSPWVISWQAAAVASSVIGGIG